MPFQISNEGDFLLARLTGTITPADLDRLAREAEAAEDALPAAMDRITDLTAVEHFDVGFSAVNQLADRRRVRKFSRPIKSAIIVHEALQYGLARMFQTLNDNPMIEIQIWHSMAEATDWLANAAKKGAAE
jgi:hypothetical protein